MKLSETSMFELCEAFSIAWCRATSANPREWSSFNRSRGQCAVTALCMQDIFGGELVRTTVAGESHYLNRIGGEDVDMTWMQFASEAGAFPYEVIPPEPRDREYVLSFPDTAFRYAMLKARLQMALGDLG